MKQQESKKISGMARCIKGRPSARELRTVMAVLKSTYKTFRPPAVTKVAQRSDPYMVLISCLISLRTKDAVTEKASERLFTKARTPDQMVQLSETDIARLIYPAGFYKTKAQRIKSISQTLIDSYNGKVPETIDELLTLKGVGRKTANLTVALGYGKPALCIDTHCHRFPNRLGWIHTKTPYETEMVLRELLPQSYWVVFNDYVVTYGQHICRPVKPLCPVCQLKRHCLRYQVEAVATPPC